MNDEKTPKKPASQRRKLVKKADPKESKPEKHNIKEDKLRDAFRAHFSGVRGKMYINFLWEENGCHRYRINWRTDIAEFEHSEFVHVTEKNGKFEIVSQTFHEVRSC